MEGAVVRLIVKAPNQQIEDQIVKCDLGWTIGRLKDYLAEVYPSKPKSSEQKLIYSGQLLGDSVFLRDVLRKYGNGDCVDHSYTVHLVCAPSKFCPDNVTSGVRCSGVENTNVATEPGTTPDRTRMDGTQNQSQNHEGVGLNTQPTPAQLLSTQQYYSQLNSQQVAWMQQAYTHYLTQYMQLMAAQGVQLQTSIPYVQPMNTNANEPVNNNNIDDQQRVLAQGIAPDVAEPNANNNGAAEEAGPGLNRDWLDLFYMLSRVIVLFSIVYFYSSPLRFLIVTFLGFAIYLYQGGFFRVQPILLADNNNGRADNNNQILQNEVLGAQAIPPQQHPPQVDPTPQAETQTNPNEEIEGQRPGALAFAWTFFSSFFASLIPDQPNVI